MNESGKEIIEEISPSVTLDQIIQITILEVERLGITLPDKWQEDLGYFLSNYRKDKNWKNKPIKRKEGLGIMCNNLDKWLEKKEYEEYKNTETKTLRIEVRKKIWILINPNIKKKLVKFLMDKKPKKWKISDINKWAPALYYNLINHNIRTKYDIKCVLNEKSYLLDKYILKDKYFKSILLTTGEYANKWDEDLGIKAMINFFIQNPKAQQKWNPLMIQKWNKGFYDFLINTHRTIDNKPNWKEIIDKYVPKIYKDKFSWLEYSIYLATGEYAKNWDERLYVIAMTNFFKENPNAQKNWNPEMIETWNSGFYDSLRLNYRLNNSVEWKIIIENYVPYKYQNKFTWRGEYINFIQREVEYGGYSLEYDENNEKNSKTEIPPENTIDSSIIKKLLLKISDSSRQIIEIHLYKGGKVNPDDFETALNEMKLHLNEFQI